MANIISDSIQHKPIVSSLEKETCPNNSVWEKVLKMFIAIGFCAVVLLMSKQNIQRIVFSRGCHKKLTQLRHLRSLFDEFEIQAIIMKTYWTLIVGPFMFFLIMNKSFFLSLRINCSSYQGTLATKEYIRWSERTDALA